MKIKREPICSDFQNGGLKNIEIVMKIISLRCAWIKRLYNQNFLDWKVIPLKLIDNTFDNNLNFS